MHVKQRLGGDIAALFRKRHAVRVKIDHLASNLTRV
jgi:hypothetical protein